METESDSYVAECFWPDVHDEDVRALDERIHASLTDGVRYLGSILIREDEVVLCQFHGNADSVRAVAALARVPYERLLVATTPRPHERSKHA